MLAHQFIRGMWLCAAATLYIGCGPGAISGQEKPTSRRELDPEALKKALEARSECPKDWEDEPLPIPGAIARIPEFHDCQRFLRTRGGAMEYGGRFAIFASERLGELESEDGLGAVGGPVLPAAQILALDEDYPELGIPYGHSCLYLFKADPTARWQARLTQLTQDCEDHIPLDILKQNSHVLHVIPDESSAYPDDYPPVARWDFDSTTSVQYIGLKCGKAWCEVGPHRGVEWEAGFAPSRRFDPIEFEAGVLSSPIKGWYDQQYLAANVPEGVSAVPTPIKGTVIPHPELGTYDANGEFANTWKLTAQVSLRVDPVWATNPQVRGYVDKYKEKYNYDVYPAPPNEIELCNGTPTDCEIPRSVSIGGSCVTPVGISPWYARISSAVDNDFTYRCVERCDYANVEVVPGTARWRWLKHDEGVWMRCKKGCCEMH